MTKRRHFFQQKRDQHIPLMLALQNRATEHSRAHGHLLGLWGPAKKKHGNGAMRCDCSLCGATVIISPALPYWTEQQRVPTTNPGMKGDALFLACAHQQESS